MIDRVGKDCCGCAACMNICPQHCIEMAANEEGFLYPHVQTEKCVNCGRCMKACPILEKKSPVKDDKRNAWAVIHQDRNVLMASSSGGLFTALAAGVFERDGCVFGAGFTEDFSRIHHMMAETPEDLYALRGSKYLQSETGDCYCAVREQLNRNRWVLFSGTPCQIAGLKGYLGRDYDQLITVDVICHGTPSACVWQHYLKHIEEELGVKATEVSFRNKKYGWRKYGISIKSDGKEIYHCSAQNDPYLRIFIKNSCLRESCYHCMIKETGFFSDITMGDLWGVERISPKTDSTLGVSLCLIHTEKGEQLFEWVKKNMYVTQLDYNQAVLYNPSLVSSAGRPRERDSFFSDLNHLSWNRIEKRYAQDKLGTIMRRKISSSPIGAVLKAVLKK